MTELLTIHYADIIETDMVNCSSGVAVSVFLQGCPHHCKGCFNPSTWDFNGGKVIEFNALLAQIKNAINKNNIQRNLSVLGGEPFAPQNIQITQWIINEIRKDFPNIIVTVWTGYTFEELQKREINLSNIDFLIDGRYEEDKRDISLKLRGSSNQRIIKLKQGEIYDII